MSLYNTRHIRPLTPSCSSLDDVALRILLDSAEIPAWRGYVRYSPAAVIEKVCFRGESVAAIDDGPSYLWGHIEVGEEGVPVPVVDLGRLPRMVWRIGERNKQWRISAPKEIVENEGSWGLLEADMPRDPADWLIQTGVCVGQSFVVRVVSRYYRCSYEYDEWDEDRSIELLWLDTPPAQLWLPHANPFAPRRDR